MKYFLAITASIMLFAGSAFAVTQGNSFAVGSDASGIELYSGVLQPITNGGVALGASSYQFSSLYLSGTATIATASVTTLTATTGGITTLTATTATVTNAMITSIKSSPAFTYGFSSATGTITAGTVTTLTSTTGNITTVNATTATVSGSLTATLATVDVAVTTPTAVGQLRVDTSGIVYVSTSAVSIGSWVKVGTQS